MPELYKTGELKLIKKIREIIGVPCGGIKVGPGDDAALLKAFTGHFLATTDMLIENIHFDFNILTPFEVGWQAMTASLSDIAAMGGWPYYALVGIGASADTDISRIIGICKGMIRLSERFACSIAGGDIVSTSGPLTISVTVIGFPQERTTFLRSTAKPGDMILVTGWPGEVAYALKENRFIKKTPRLEEIKYLRRKIKINAVIDISDGLSSDLARVSEESRVGAIVFEDKLPVAPILKKIDRKKRLDMILNGGEDFELLFTTPKSNLEDIVTAFKNRFNIPVTVIGEIMPQRYGLRIMGGDGKKKILKPEGYEHFRR